MPKRGRKDREKGKVGEGGQMKEERCESRWGRRESEEMSKETG